MNRFDLHLIVGSIKNLHVGTSRDHVADKAKGLPTDTVDQSDGYQFDSERFDHFACYIGENFVSGTFRSVRFKEGDEVSAVIMKRPDKDDLCVAVLPKETSQLHLQLMMSKGTLARFLQPVKWLSIAGLAGFIFFLTISIFHSKSIREFLKTNTIMALVFLGIIVVMTLWDYYLGTGQREGEVATAVFELIGLPDPMRLNLWKYSLLHRHGDPLGECIYEVGELLEKT